MKKLNIVLLIAMISTPILGQQDQTKMKETLSEYKFSTKTLTLDHVEIAYQEAGTGDITLLFVHGLSSNSDAWVKNIQSLKNTYRCIAIDLPGFGKSSIPKADYTPTYFAEIIYKFIKKKQIESVVLLGHSMGGQASIKLALDHPEVVEKLILIAPAGIEKFTASEGQMIKNIYNTEMVKQTTDEQIKQNFKLNFYTMPDDVSKMINDRINIKNSSDFDLHCEAIVKSISGMLDDPVREELSGLEQHTLIIFGKNDMLIPNRYLHPTLSVSSIGATAENLIPKSQLYFIEAAGHFVQFEKPEEINNLINAFLEQ